MALALLLDKGADAAAVQNDGSTPLHLAARLGPAECVELLLARGGAGRTSLLAATPWDAAVWARRPRCVALLTRRAPTMALFSMLRVALLLLFATSAVLAVIAALRTPAAAEL